jgi:hypothetical protein
MKLCNMITIIVENVFALPFNHLDNDYDFKNALTELRFTYARPNLEDLDDLILIKW